MRAEPTQLRLPPSRSNPFAYKEAGFQKCCNRCQGLTLLKVRLSLVQIASGQSSDPDRSLSRGVRAVAAAGGGQSLALARSRAGGLAQRSGKVWRLEYGGVGPLS